ncbi:MAG: pseudouridine synthase [Pseudodonghicola sp.]|nr:pseudouridine synthase [Pseudodonghicola sp.]
MSTQPPPDTPEGDRIAKILSRAGVASRREAERMIEAGRVSVNGKVIDSPALNVTDSDRIVVDGKPLAAPEPARLWLYHKPSGRVTTERDELDRPTIFDDLPEEMPRVMSVGRLDLNSEGLLLLTNDGAIKRQLELPSTGWLRKYRVRIKGRPKDEDFEPLRKGITIDGDKFQPMIVSVDRQQGANAWLTIGLREGKNREIRRAMEEMGFSVNRLIRISYGPFQLGTLKAGAVEEIRRRVMRDQLGLDSPDDVNTPPDGGHAKPRLRSNTKPGGKPGGKPGTKPGAAPWEKPRSGPGGKPGGKPGSGKPGGKPSYRPDSRSSGGPGSKPGAKPGEKPGARSGPKSGPRSGAKPGPGFGAKPGTKPDTRSSPRPQGNRPTKPRRG